MNTPKKAPGLLRACLAIAGCALACTHTHATTYTETSEAFRNPMKGFRPSRYITEGSFPSQEYATIYKDYMPYSSMEATASDTVQKIKDYCNSRWSGIESQNIKVIPRVVIYYPDVGEYWGDIPHDGTPGQWNTDALKSRLVAFIAKLGQAWDNDPRVAAVELGLWGKWGEHNIYPDQINGSDRIPAAFQTALGDAATAAFHHKVVMVRYPETFSGYDFGMIWDSFALPDDSAWATAMSSRTTWQTKMISGEVAYDWGDQSHLGGSPDGTLGSTSNTDYVIGYIQSTHCSSLGWIAEYSSGNSTIAANAARMQKAFGYRFVVTNATVPTSVNAGGTLSLSFTVENHGSAPFYYAWPIEVSLLNPSSHAVVWSTTLSTDIRAWLPGNAYTVNASFTVPTSVPNGTYTLALAVLDPAGNKPSLRFANTNYYTGGRTPLAKVGVGQTASDQNLGTFNGLQADTTLSYSLTTTVQIPSAPNLLTPTTGNGSVSLSWSASDGATSYTVLRSTTSGSGYATIVNTSGSSYTDSGLTNGTTYYYVVRASNSAGTSGNSNQVSATPSASVPSVTYEAESSANTLAGGAVVSSSASSSGGMKVGYLGNGGSLTFNGVNASSAGSYTLTISYLSGEARGLRITVNNGSPVTASLPSTGGWDTVGSYATSVTLNAGANTIRLDNPSGWAPDIDKIVVSGGSSVTAPSAPTGLTATAGNGSVSLSWSAASGAASYAVRRSTTSGSGYASIASTSATSYTDTGVSNGTTYYYVVTASNSAGTSGNSSQASATPSGGVTTPSAPTGLTATAGNASVALSWNASSGATSYTLLRSTTSGSGYASLTTTSGTSYTDTGVTNGTTYYYVARASNSAGTSGNSAQASATPASGGGGGVPVTIDSFTSSTQFYANQNDLGQAISGTCSWYLGSDAAGNLVLNSSSTGQYYQENVNRSLSGASTIRLRVRDWWASDTAQHWTVVINDGTDHASPVLSTYGAVTDSYGDINIPIAAFGSVNLSSVSYIRIVHSDSVYAALLVDAISAQ